MPISDTLDARIKAFSHQGLYQHEHTHTEGQLFVLHSGSCIVSCEQRRWLMVPNRPCWIAPNARHSVLAEFAVSGTTVLFAEAMSALLPQSSAVFRVSSFFLSLMARLLEAVEDHPRLSRLLAVLVDEIQNCSHDSLSLPMPQHPRLLDLATEIVKEPSDSRTIADCSVEVGMSPRSFSRKFSVETGLSFVQWRLRARLLRAVQLLQTGLTITQAAFDVGYESPSAFSVAFKELVGSTPREFLGNGKGDLSKFNEFRR